MIEVHPQNHIHPDICTPIPKSNRDCFVSIEEFQDDTESGAYQAYDCDGVYACIGPDGVKYKSRISVDSDDDPPEWATHVLWSSK